jgi:hypothetical protein
VRFKNYQRINEIKHVDSWDKIIDTVTSTPVMDARINDLHSTTKTSTNEINEEKEIQKSRNLNKRAEKGKNSIHS